MKIILSPSKTQDFTNQNNREITSPYFENLASDLAEKIRKLSKEELGQVMNIKGDLLEKTYEDYKAFDNAQVNHAIYTYTGLVYKYMNISDYDEEILGYLNEHLCILSALYGVLKPFDGIKPYRLDMKMQFMEKTLYNYWKENMANYFANEMILNLASVEFSKMISLPMITVGFREYKDGIYKNLATYSKMARGILLDYMIKNKIKEVDELRKISFEGYHYNDDLSDEKTIMFTRND